MGNLEARAARQERLAIAVAAAIAAVDLGTKAAVINLSAVLKLPFVVPVQNASYTLGIGGSDHNFLLLSLVSTLVLVGAGWLYRPLLRRGNIRPVSAGMILGGAAGNLGDRLAHGAVTDFLWLPWVIVNVADVAVLIGLLTLVPRLRWVQLLARSHQQQRGSRSGAPGLRMRLLTLVTRLVPNSSTNHDRKVGTMSNTTKATGLSWRDRIRTLLVLASPIVVIIVETAPRVRF